MTLLIIVNPPYSYEPKLTRIRLSGGCEHFVPCSWKQTEGQADIGGQIKLVPLRLWGQRRRDSVCPSGDRCPCVHSLENKPASAQLLSSIRAVYQL